METTLKFKGTPIRSGYKTDNPQSVCMCGSTCLLERFCAEGINLTLLDGKLILSVGSCNPNSETPTPLSTEEADERERNLDKLHKRRLKLAGEILV